MPKALIVARYFAGDQNAIEALAAEIETVAAQMTEMEEEHGGEEGAFAELDKINRATVTARLKELKAVDNEEARALYEYLKLCEKQADLKKCLVAAENKLDELAYAKYPTLTEADIHSPKPTFKRWSSKTNGSPRSTPPSTAKWIASVRR